MSPRDDLVPSAIPTAGAVGASVTTRKGSAAVAEARTAGGAGAGGPEDVPLYRARVKVHPKDVKGKFRRLKWAALGVLLAIYYLAPWLRWDRGPGAPDQALLIDMPARRAYFLWIEIWPQEVYYITFLLMLGAFGLFFATSLFGRVWCGFSCPQTVWTDLFMWVERKIEGDRGARIRLDKAPWTPTKILRRTAKHAAWLLISVLTGGAWVLYFNDAPTLVRDFAHLEVSGNVLFFIGLFAGTTYLLAGFAREHVCTYMCPWPRFQAAMMDEHSMIVSYEAWRGEPRGRAPRDGDFTGRGHCIDCGQCVAVCPTGIDIRDGNQLECIGCGLCIDACNDVMQRVGLPGNLIAYDSVVRQQTRARGGESKIKFVRARTIIYGVLVLLVAGVMVALLATRSNLDVSVLRDRNPIYVPLANGDIRNGYTFKILNKAAVAMDYELALIGLDGAAMSVLGSDEEGRSLHLSAKPDEVATYRIFIRAPRSALKGESTAFGFLLTGRGEGAETAQYDAVFLGPK